MHPNPVFHDRSTEDNLAFARARAFGVLSVNGQDGPMLSHIPFQLSEDGRRIEAHLVRSNPIARALGEPLRAVLAVSGGDAYVSPDWYGIDDQVPTWNYVAVHLRGTLERLPDEELRGILERLSAAMEGRLSPKAPWKLDKLDGETYAKLSRMIVPVTFSVESVDGTWKLSQNKDVPVIEGAVNGLRETGFRSEVAGLADLMASKIR